LVHISQLANYHVAKVEDVVKIGEHLKVEVSEIDEMGRINLTHKPFAPEPTPEQLAASASSNFDRGARPAPRAGFRGGSGGSRGGSGGRPPRKSFDR
jgi:polyribonucleotide nucleotidyltransferase